MSSQIFTTLCGTASPLVPELQCEPDMVVSPSPPSVDIFPAEDFASFIGMGTSNVEFRFVVRTRVGTADSEGAQLLLKSMMDPRATTSVEKAILADTTLGGKVENVHVEERSGFGLFPYPADPEGGSLVGATLTVKVTP